VKSSLLEEVQVHETSKERLRVLDALREGLGKFVVVVHGRALQDEGLQNLSSHECNDEWVERGNIDKHWCHLELC